MANKTEFIIAAKLQAQGQQNLNRAAKEIKNVSKAAEQQAKAQKRVKSSTKGAKGEADKLKETMRQLAASIAVIDGPFGGVSSRFNAFGTTVGRVSKNLIAFTAALIGASAASRIGLKAYAEMEKLTFRLEKTLENTARTAAISTEEVLQFAERLGKETLASREGALEAFTTIASFTEIPTSKIEELTSLAQDLTVILGGNLKQNAVLIGRAMNDAGSAAEFLRRKGLQLTDQQRDQIETFVANGEQMKAITFLQKELANITGIAAGEAKGLAGLIDTLGERLRITTMNFVKYTGIAAAAKGIVSGLTTALSLLDKIIVTVAKSVAFLTDNTVLLIPVLTSLAVTVVPKLVSSFRALASSAILRFFPQLVKGTTKGVKSVKLLAVAWGLVKSAVSSLWKLLLANPLVLIIASLGLIALKITQWVNGFDTLTETFDKFVQQIRIGLVQLELWFDTAMTAMLHSVDQFITKAKFKLADSPLNKLFRIDIDQVAADFVAAEGEYKRRQAKLQKDAEDKTIDILGMGVDTSGIERARDELKRRNEELKESEKKRLESLKKQADQIRITLSAQRLILEGKAKELDIAKLMVQANEETSEEHKKQRNLILSRSIQERLNDRVISLKEEVLTLREKGEALRLVLSGQAENAELAELELRLKEDLTDQEKELIQQKLNSIQANEKLTDSVSRQKQEWEQVNDAVKNTFKDILLGSESVAGALSKLASKLADIALESAFANFSIQGMFGGGGGSPLDFFLPNAKGNAFVKGKVQEFARGGVVNSPTFFPMKSGAGLMGEAGPEGILPLERGKGGKLGVNATGLGGNLTVPVTVNMSIEGGGNNQDITDPSVAERMGSMIGNAVQTEVYKVLDRERRTGGRLSSTNRGGQIE